MRRIGRRTGHGETRARGGGSPSPVGESASASAPSGGAEDAWKVLPRVVVLSRLLLLLSSPGARRVGTKAELGAMCRMQWR